MLTDRANTSKIKKNSDNLKQGTKHIKTVSSKSKIQKTSNQMNQTKKLKPIDKTNRCVKMEQLEYKIEEFHTQLATIDLQSLMSSLANANTWISQQHRVLLALWNQLQKIKIDNHLYQIYSNKLNGAKIIIENISKNVNMLDKMALASSYHSGGSSLASAGSNFPSRTHLVCSEQLIGSEKSQTEKNFGQQLTLTHTNYEILTQGSPMKSSNFRSEQSSYDIDEDKENHQNVINIKASQETLCSQEKLKKQASESLKLQKFKRKAYGSSRNVGEALGIKPDNVRKMANEFQKRLSKLEEQIQFKEKNQEYLRDMIKELKIQLLEKDQQIQRILINEEGYEAKWELILNDTHQKENQLQQKDLELRDYNKQLEHKKEKIIQLQSTIRNMQSQLERNRVREAQLLQIIKFQRQRTINNVKDKEAEEAAKLEEQEKVVHLQMEVKQLRKQLKQSQRDKRKQRQKCEIYQRKYFCLLAERETQRQTSVYYSRLQRISQNRQEIVKLI